MVSTPEHLATLTERLLKTGVKLPTSTEQGVFVALDARRCLSQFMVNGHPDRGLFRSVIMAVLDRIRASGYPKVRLFGEMVDILWAEDRREAALELEALWNEVLAEYDACLLCAYRLDPVDSDLRRGVLEQITRCHSHSFSE